MENLPYIYHPEKIKVIGIVPYPRLNYYMRSYNRKKRIYFITLWLNSMSHIFYYLSPSSLYMMVKSFGCDLDDQLILDILNEYHPEKPHFCIFTHFEWNQPRLYNMFGSKKEVEKYKYSIRNKYSGENKHQDKTNILLNLYENNKDIMYRDMILALKSKMSKPTALKVLKENNIVLEKKSKSFILIEKKLKDLFQYRIDNVKTKLTYVLLSEYISVNLKTLNRFLLTYPEYKEKIVSFNKSL